MLLDSVKDPQVKSVNLKVAIQFVKDNGIEAQAESGSPLGRVSEDPFIFQ